MSEIKVGRHGLYSFIFEQINFTVCTLKENKVYNGWQLDSCICMCVSLNFLGRGSLVDTKECWKRNFKNSRNMDQEEDSGGEIR